MSKEHAVSELETIELLETTHSFPCRYVFKVIGRVDQGFVARVVAAIRDELESTVDPPYKLRHAAGGRHVAVTVEPTVLSAYQVLAVYRRMRGMAGVVMVM